MGGSVHFDVFAPLLVRIFGDAWFERGTLSLYFLNAVVHGEPVQAVAKYPVGAAKQIQVSVRRADDPAITAGAGTASLGTDPKSELRTRDLRLSDPSSLRVFQDLTPGTVLGEEVRMLSTVEQQADIEGGSLNEPLPWYTEASPWGGPIAAPSHVYELASPYCAMLALCHCTKGTRSFHLL